jgi:hypothetical protein
MNFFAGDDFVNQKGHTKSEEERNKIFQDKPGDGSHIHERAHRVTLNKGNRGGECHTHD